MSGSWDSRRSLTNVINNRTTQLNNKLRCVVSSYGWHLYRFIRHHVYRWYTVTIFVRAWIDSCFIQRYRTTCFYHCSYCEKDFGSRRRERFSYSRIKQYTQKRRDNNGILSYFNANLLSLFWNLLPRNKYDEVSSSSQQVMWWVAFRACIPRATRPPRS